MKVAIDAQHSAHLGYYFVSVLDSTIHVNETGYALKEYYQAISTQ